MSNDKTEALINLEISSIENCIICLETSDEPVVTLCGHHFCKSCIYKWIKMKPSNQVCPVCKSSIKKKNLIRLYQNRTDENESEDEELSEVLAEDQSQIEVNNLINNQPIFILVENTQTDNLTTRSVRLIIQ